MWRINLHLQNYLSVRDKSALAELLECEGSLLETALHTFSYDSSCAHLLRNDSKNSFFVFVKAGEFT